MDIVCIADTHGLHDRIKVPPGDILVHAGDFTERGEPAEVDLFLDWLENQPHPHKIFIGGNHDAYLEQHPDYFAAQVRAIPRVTYLEDSGAIIAGLRIWGSPVQPWYFQWAFNRHRGPEIRHHWDLIPLDTEVLITHGPPAGILDRNFRGERHGCADLLDVINTRLTKLRLHVFGHLHPDGGQCINRDGRLFVNAAVCDERGYASRAPVVVRSEWGPKSR